MYLFRRMVSSFGFTSATARLPLYPKGLLAGYLRTLALPVVLSSSCFLSGVRFRKCDSFCSPSSCRSVRRSLGRRDSPCHLLLGLSELDDRPDPADLLLPPPFLLLSRSLIVYCSLL